MYIFRVSGISIAFADRLRDAPKRRQQQTW